MTGVRARRVDGAEVKLDTASYRLRDRFFGSRVGRRALMAVALTFGRRGMALLEFQLRMRRLVGERVRSAAGSSEGLSNELYERVQRPSATAYSNKSQSRSSSSHLQLGRASRNDKEGPGEAWRAPRAEASGRALKSKVRVIHAQLLRCQEPKKRPRRSCGDLIHALGKPPGRCAPAEALSKPARHLCGSESA